MSGIRALKGHGEKLSRKAQEAVTALLETGSLTQAAQRVRVNERTLRRWMMRDDFRERCHTVSRQTFDQALNRIRAISDRAAETLNAALDGQATATQVQAAKAVLDLATRMRDHDRELEAVQNLGVRFVVFFAHIVEQHVHDEPTRAAIKRDFLALNAAQPRKLDS